MDSTSSYNKDLIQSTKDLTVSDEFSIESLIDRVDEFQRRDYLETIERLNSENGLLQHLVLKYQRDWCFKIETFVKAQEAVLLLQKALEQSVKEGTAAAKDWLDFLGIREDCSDYQSRRPTGWI